MQVDGYSLDAQKEKLKKYAAYEEMQIVGEYSDEGHSGKNIAGRPDVVNGRFCPQSVRSFCPIVAGFNAGTYKVPACVL